ncbi:hypothetical protein [Alkaliphilus peptidifermentans]|uniref:Uncharacterized protein n=1 Tax=Alkaliphilus peptidifermentans DSM 18978 TaxID=1120976 RepID=A0A1G5BGQ4_9FIRM|nr:hypothetical protein [Alkaliphilus peptidifermentans]SCX89299.1 hypothetical protein SAMN03080606_00412 [Alkaliphilus peptidifermentans DSM 18978]
MEILIRGVDNSDMDSIIDFNTEYGNGKAVWNGNSDPEVGNKYNVEYDITDILEWNKTVSLSKEKSFKIFIEEEITHIIGVLEKVYKDGISDLRFGNSIIQLEVEGKDLPVGEYVLVKADSLEVYDTVY